MYRHKSSFGMSQKSLILVISPYYTTSLGDNVRYDVCIFYTKTKQNEICENKLIIISSFCQLHAVPA